MPTKSNKQPALPNVDEALPQLTRRHLRAILFLVLRIICVALLSALLAAKVPFLARNRALLDVLSGILVLWPFYTALGNLYAHRIALGRAYFEAGQKADAERTLAPFTWGARARLFDAMGEGRYFLAASFAENGQLAQANQLFAEITLLSKQSPWGEKARAAIQQEHG